jgi:hypothetical protein
VSGYRTTVRSRTAVMVRGARVPRWWCGYDEDSCGHQIASSRDGEAEASPSARGCVALIDGFLENGM